MSLFDFMDTCREILSFNREKSLLVVNSFDTEALTEITNTLVGKLDSTVVNKKTLAETLIDRKYREYAWNATLFRWLYYSTRLLGVGKG